MDSGRVFVGCAGWSYPHWNGVIYPKPRPRSFEPLAFLAAHLDAVEINASFHRPLDPRVTERWLRLAEPNPEFLFTAKLGRQFTHDRLTAASAVAFFKQGLWPLMRAKHFGALLMQFPPEFRFTTANQKFFRTLRRAFHEFPLVAEMRHESWEMDEAVAFVRDLKVGLSGERKLTSATGYVRASDASADVVSLASNVERLAPLSDRYFVFFTADQHGASFMQAAALRALLTGRTFEPAQSRLDFNRPAA